MRRIAWGLVLAAALSGCGNGRGTGDGAQGTYDALTSLYDIQTSISDAPVPAGEADGQAAGESGGGLPGETGREPDGNAGGGLPGETGREPDGNAAGELSGAAGDAEGGIPGNAYQQPTVDSGNLEVTLVMVGDILLHTPVAESGLREDGIYDFSAVFAQMKEEIQAADLALVNQEVILGGAQLGVSGYPAFNAPFELGDALVDAGFDVVLHATNHALDKGKKGVLNCLSFWRENYPDMAVLGIHDSQEAQQEIYVYEQQGIRIAVLNYTYGTNGIPLPGDMPYAVDMLDRERVEADLRRAGELADFVVVCPHWGTEYTLSATKEQQDWAALFAENGADLILGTHPHVIEPIEWVKGDTAPGGEPDGETMAPGGTLVYYSLGNFVNWTSGTGLGVANRMVGGMARVTIGLDDAGEAVIKDYDVEPLVCHVEQGFGGVTVYPLDRYTEELAEGNEIVRQDSSFSLEYCRQLVQDVFGQDQ